MSTHPWPSEWLRGLLSLAVMRVLAAGPTYGYAISATLEDNGFGAIKGGTLYPLLGRLESAGLVTTQWRAGEGGPGRKYFRLTEDGMAEFERQATLWGEFAAHTSAFLGNTIIETKES